MEDWINVDNLPKYKNNTTDWSSCCGMSIDFNYEGVSGSFIIKNKIKDSDYVIIEYLGVEYKMLTYRLKKCQLGKLINPVYTSFKYCVDDIIEGKSEKKFLILDAFIKNNTRHYKIKCLVCNEEKVIIANRVEKNSKNIIGCGKCSNNVNSNTYDFIKKSKNIHGELYDYSLVDYINCKTNVKIICKTHGVFEQNPNSHLMGRGCNSCNNVGTYNKTLTERNKNKWQEEFVYVYIFKMYNDLESFIKIGISKNIRSRIRKLKQYNCEPLFEFKIDRYNASYLEKALHKKYINYKYSPIYKFSGHTECFNVDIPIDDIISTINEYEMITNE